MASSLLDWVAHLLRDPDARHAFEDHPHRYAEEQGFHHLSNADVHDVLNLIIDGEHQYGHHHQYPAPRPWEHGRDERGADYLRSYFRDNRDHFQDHGEHDEVREASFVRHNTNVDNSVHQKVDTGDHDHDRHGDRWDDPRWDGDRWDDDRPDHHGGNFNQAIDNDPVVASGHHSVASGGDITGSAITASSHSVVGDNDHAATGHDNTTAFGAGDANQSNLDHVHTGHGGSLSFGGDAYGRDEHNETSTAVHNSGSGSTSVTAAGNHGYANQYADQHASDDSTRSHYSDHTISDTHNDVDSNNDSRYADNHDVDVHHG